MLRVHNPRIIRAAISTHGRSQIHLSRLRFGATHQRGPLIAPGRIALLARFSNMALIAGILDIVVFNPLSTWVGIYTLNAQPQLSVDEKRAIVTKRFLDMFWSDAYWVAIFAMERSMRRVLERHQGNLVGQHPKGHLALRGVSNLIGLLTGALINEILKPISSNLLTAHFLQQFRVHGYRGSWLGKLFELFGYRE